MKSSKTLALVLASVAVAITSGPIIGQSLPPPGGGLTLEQYVGLQERVNAFCLFLDANVKAGKPLPDGDLSIGAYVYTGSEVKALITHCDMVMRLMQSVVDATRRTQ
jgi:hypothetical protein